MVSVTLPEGSGGNGPLSYSIITTGSVEIGHGLEFDSDTRVLAGTVPVNTLASVSEHFYRVQDADAIRDVTDRTDLRFTITILAAADTTPIFGDATIAAQSYYLGEAVSLTLPAASGGNGTLRYDLVPVGIPGLSDLLPTGLSFDNARRVLSGAPIRAQAARAYTYTATDGDLINPDSASLIFMIAITDTTPTFAGATIPTQTYFRGDPVNLTLPQAGGGDGGLRYTVIPRGARALSAIGLAFNGATRVISGTVPTGATQNNHLFDYRVEDADSNTGPGDRTDLRFTIFISTADRVPTFGGATIPGLTFTARRAITDLTLPEATGGDGELRYNLAPTTGQGLDSLPDGLTFDHPTRILSGAPSMVQAAAGYTYTVIDTDAISPNNVSLNFTITIVESAVPFFTVARLPQVTYRRGEVISVTLPEANGGDGELDYELILLEAGSHADLGLQFSPATRVLSGTLRNNVPLGLIRFFYIVHDADDDRSVFDRTFQHYDFVVIERDQVPAFANDANIPDQAWTTGIAITELTLPQATGGDGTLIYTLAPTAGQGLSGLPDGVAFDDTTRILSGAPSTVQTAAEYTYTATDSDADSDPDSATLTFMISVAENAPAFAPGASIFAQTYRQGDSVHLTLPTAFGGNGQLTYTAIPQGGAPTLGQIGLTLDRITRVLSGTVRDNARLGPSAFDYRVQDADDNMAADDRADIRFTITITVKLVIGPDTNGPPVFLVSNYPPIVLVVGASPPSFVLPSATGGDGDLVYSFDPTPALPLNLRFNPATQNLSGTRATAVFPATDFTYRVRDSDVNNTEADTDTLTINIAVQADVPPAFAPGTTIPDQNYVVNTALTPVELPVATGGNPPRLFDDSGNITYTITPALPAGLTFDGAANPPTITGTPQALQTTATTYTYRAADKDANTAAADTVTLEFTITIVPDLVPAFATDADIDDQIYFMGAAIAELTLPQATGGDGTLRYTLAPTAGQGLSGLPVGLSFDGMTRVLSGAPATVQAAAEYTYTATDGDAVNPDSVTLTFTITINEAAVTGGTTATATPLLIDAAGNTESGGAAGGTLVLSGIPDGVTPSHRIESNLLYGELTLDSATGAWTYQLDNSRAATKALGPGDSVTDAGSVITTLGDREITSAIRVALPAGTFPDDPPIATALVNGSAADVTTDAFTVITLSGAGSDPESALITGYAWAQTGGATVDLAPDANAREVTFTAPESPGTLAFTLTVMTATQSSPALPVRVGVESVPNRVPTFDPVTSLPAQVYFAGEVVSVTLPEGSGGNGPLRYEIGTVGRAEIGYGLELDSDTRVLAGTVPVDTPASVSEHVYVVQDADAEERFFDRDELRFTITILAPPPPPDTTPTFGDATIAAQNYYLGEAVSLTLPAASGGNGTLSYDLVPVSIPGQSDLLPFGLRFDGMTRVLSGPPATLQAAREYTYTVTDGDDGVNADDSNPDSVSLGFMIAITDTSPTFAVVTFPTQNYFRGDAVSVTLPEAGGGDGALRYTVIPRTSLPLSALGLTFDGATRVISGTVPINAVDISGRFDYRVQDADSNMGAGDRMDIGFFIFIDTTDLVPTFGATTIADQTFTAGRAITPLTLPEAGGGNGALRYTLAPSATEAGCRTA